MPRRAALRKPRPGRPGSKPSTSRRWPPALVATAAALGLAIAGLIAASWALGRPARLFEEAERATKARDWDAAARAWHAYNEGRSDADALLNEARAWLATGHAARAEQALDRSIAVAPARPEPWLLRLEMLRVEDRPVEALDVGWRAYAAVPGAARRLVLRGLTLALLADTPEEIARGTLARWSEADARDVDARVALLRRMAASPRPDDPDTAARVAELAAILGRNPANVPAREALVLAQAEAGDPDWGREALASWPEALRDARYHRLRGRRSLEDKHQAGPAAASLALALDDLPHDWKTRNRLARALNASGREADARKAAEAVERLREALDPLALGKRIDADLAAIDEPKSRLDLADLCERVGLVRLAEAWRRDAETPRGARPAIAGGRG